MRAPGAASMARLFARLLLAVLAVGCGSGCVAVNMGRLETFRHTETMERVGAEPVRSHVAAARVQLLQEGNRAEVQVAADVEEEYERFRHERELVVRRQKRLAFGLFPGASEIVWTPRGALTSFCGWNVRHGADTEPEFRAYYSNGVEPGMGLFVGDQVRAWIMTFGLVGTLATVESLVLWPFTDWGCVTHDYIDADCYRHGVGRNGAAVADASESPKLQALAEFPEGERRKIGVHTCFEPEAPVGMQLLTHCGLAGFHKYQVVFVDVPDRSEGKKCGTVKRMRKAGIAGPFEVELSVPGLGHTERRAVGRGERKAVFVLPAGSREGRYEVQVAVRECRGETGRATPEWTRQAIRNLAGQASRFDVNLQAAAGGRGASAGGYSIVGIRPSRDGKYVVRAKVKDASRVLDVAWEIEADIRRRIREDYASRHPEARAEDIRDAVEWGTVGENGDVLEFTGWAFSARPLRDGWSYDAGSRRGTVRVAVSDGAPTERVRQWAAENVEAIVADKNVGVMAGGEAPAGGRYRVVADRFENGVLTIEFEAVE